MMRAHDPQKSMPSVIRGTLNTTDEWNGTPVGPGRWFKWLESAGTFIYGSRHGVFTACRETKQDGAGIWIGYLTIRGEVRKTYLGPGGSLSAERLERAGRRLNV